MREKKTAPERTSLRRTLVVHNVAQILIAAGGIAAGLGGCGAGNHGFPMEEVSGSVSYQDKPLPRGTVVLHPAAGTPGPLATGTIGDDGRYRIKTAGIFGAAVGEHRVTVDFRGELTPEDESNLVVHPLLIPHRYASVDKTPLRFTVQEDRDNTLNIVLDGLPPFN